MKQYLLPAGCRAVLLFLCLLLVPLHGYTQNTFNNTPWPIRLTNPSGNTPAQLFGGYGQYEGPAAGDGNTTNRSFHEGLDMLADSGTNVYPGVDGVVVHKVDTFIPGIGRYSNGVLIKVGNNVIPPVLNLVPGGGVVQQPEVDYLWFMHTEPKPGLHVGDNVYKDVPIGKVAKAPAGFLDHLHFSWHYLPASLPVASCLNYIRGNPIQRMSNRNMDANKPVIDAIRYRRQSGELLPNPTYFNKKTASERIVVNEATDIVAKIMEYFYNANYPLPPVRIEFKIRRYPSDTAVKAQGKIEFLDKFLADYTPHQGDNHTDKFRNQAGLTHIFYENDNTCTSDPRKSIPDPAHKYWFILTNQSSNVPKNDAPLWSWHTHAKENTGWNKIQADPADSNKRAHCPDGQYIVAVKAEGYGGIDDTNVRRDTIFVNNFNESLSSCDSGGVVRDSFCIGRPVYIRGTGYPKETEFDLYVIKRRNSWSDGVPLDAQNQIPVRTITSDQNGDIPVTKIWEDYQPNPVGPNAVDSGYDIILDYDRDILLTTPKEGFTVDVKDDPYNRFSIIGARPLKIDSLILTKAGCKNGDQCNGVARLVVSGGHQPYTYWVGARKDINPIDSLCPFKSYKIRVWDADSCFVDTVVDVTGDSSTVIAHCSSEGNVMCALCNGAAAVSGSGGTPPYSYWWFYNGSQDSSIAGLCAGTYSVIVTDFNGCDDTCAVTIGRDDSDLDISCSGTDASCGKCNGSATATVSGGTPPYSYSWTGGRTGATINNLCPGIYHCLVSDSNGCFDTCSVVIKNGNSNLSATCSKTDNTSCFPCNGSATITASGGTPPYTYSWPGGTRTGLCAGTYTGTVTDANGCSASCQVTINGSSNGPTATCSSTPSQCKSCTGTVSVSASGGTPPYTFSCSGGALTGLCPGSHTCTVTDANGCSAQCIVTVGKILDSNCLDTTHTDTVIIPKPPLRQLNTRGTQPIIDRVYPNPFTEEISIDFYSPEQGRAVITVQNATGTTEKTIELPVDRGNHAIRIDGRHLPKGIHFIRLTISGSVVVKVLKL